MLKKPAEVSASESAHASATDAMAAPIQVSPTLGLFGSDSLRRSSPRRPVKGPVLQPFRPAARPKASRPLAESLVNDDESPTLSAAQLAALGSLPNKPSKLHASSNRHSGSKSRRRQLFADVSDASSSSSPSESDSSSTGESNSSSASDSPSDGD